MTEETGSSSTPEPKAVNPSADAHQPVHRPRPPISYKSKPGAFAQQAAQASWIAPLLATTVNCMLLSSEDRTTKLLVGVFAVLMIVAGLVFAVIAIVGAIRRPPRWILAPALIGLVVNGFLVIGTVTAFGVANDLANRQRAPIVAAPTPKEVPDDSWKPTEVGFYIDDQNKFALKLPGFWSIEAGPAEIMLIAYAPADGPDDGFFEHVLVGVMDYPADEKVDFLRRSETERINGIPDSLIFGKGEQVISGKQFLWLDSQQVDEGVEVRTLKYFYSSYGRAYLFIFTSAPQTNDRYRPIFDDVAKSIHIP